jgi:hypothetical protein
MSWRDLRESTDAALKAMALLPGAREGDDSDVLEHIGKLSAALRHVDYFVNELGTQLNLDGDDDDPQGMDVGKTLC